MRRRLVAIVALAGLAGCRPDPSKPNCDLDALVRLGERLSAQPVATQVDEVWPGIVAACGDGLPMPLADYFARIHDPSLPPDTVLRRNVDPVLRALQRRACPDLDEVGREAGDATWELRAGIFHAGCDYARFGVLSADEVAGAAWHDELVDEAEKLRLLEQLHNQPWTGVALIGADAQTPFATITAVVRSASAAGFTRIGFAVAPEGFRPT